MKKVLSLIIGIVFLLTLVGCSSDKATTNEKRKIIDYSDKITKSAEGFTKTNKLVVVAKNTSDADVDLTFKVNFYDGYDTLIGSDTPSLIGVGPGAEVAVLVNNTPYGFARYEIAFEAKTSIYTKTFYKDIKLTDNKKLTVSAKVKNNSKETIDYVSAAIVYYQSGAIVGYDSNSIYTIKAGETGLFNFYQPNDEYYNEVPYDTYKVFINESYSYRYVN